MLEQRQLFLFNWIAATHDWGVGRIIHGSASTINLWCALELRTIFDRINAPIFYEIFISFLFDEKKTFIITQNEYIFNVARLYTMEVSLKIHNNFYFWSIFFNRIIIIIQCKVYKVLIINAQASFVQDKRIFEYQSLFKKSFSIMRKKRVSSEFCTQCELSWRISDLIENDNKHLHRDIVLASSITFLWIKKRYYSLPNGISLAVSREWMMLRD